MTPSEPDSPAGGDRRLARLAGGVLLTDGLIRAARGRAALPLPAGRRLGAAEATLGLALLDRAPIEPASLYGAIAPVYDGLAPIWRDWLYRDAAEALDTAIVEALPPGAAILDLGCGTGAVLERLLALGARVGSYTGVDLSPAMLARARAKLGGVAGARFEQLDLRAGPLPAGPFDLVVSAWALEHLPDPGAVVAAARARLRPSGRVVAFFELDFESGDGSPRARPLRRLMRLFGVRLVPEHEARSWPGLVSLRRFRALGPDVAVAVLTASPAAPTQ